jgi:biotin carboxyl carrier protein
VKYFVQLDAREVLVDVDGDRVMVDGVSYHASLESQPGTPLRVLMVDGRPRTLAVQPLGRSRWTIGVGGEQREIEVIDERARHIRSLASAAGRSQRSGTFKAPMPGLVVRVQVEPGQTVGPGGGLLVLEAMKMENELRTASGGRVRAVLVAAGQAVEKGQALVELE